MIETASAFVVAVGAIEVAKFAWSKAGPGSANGAARAVESHELRSELRALRAGFEAAFGRIESRLDRLIELNK